METLYIFLGAIGAGFLAGLLGLGGGVMLVPLLSVFVGLSIRQAVGIALVSSIATSMASSVVFIKKDLCDIDLGMKLAITGMIGGLSGGTLSAYVSNEYLAFLLSGILLYSGASIALRKDNSQTTHSSDRNKNLALYLALAFLGGVASGLLGLGGGIIFVPIMVLGLKLPMQRAVGTSSLIVGLVATAGAVIYFLRGELGSSLEILPAVVVGMVIGGKTGGLIGVKVKSRVTRLIFGALLFYMSYRMIKMGLGG